MPLLYADLKQSRRYPTLYLWYFLALWCAVAVGEGAWLYTAVYGWTCGLGHEWRRQAAVARRAWQADSALQIAQAEHPLNDFE
jgi:hypothetical protein